MKLSLIMCLYNAWPVARQALVASMSKLDRSLKTEVLVIDNHGPDEIGRKAVREVALVTGDIAVLDPKKTLGGHGGWNFGYAASTGDVVCKLDDDTVILTDGWNRKLYEALQHVPEVAYVSADIDAKQQNVYNVVTLNGETLEVPEAGIVGFSLVAIRRADIERWGPMQPRYRAAGGKVVSGPDRLYGGEEAYYALKARADGRMIAHYPAVKCHHLSNEERHPDYAAWKRAYGYHAWTDKDMVAWIAAGEHVMSYARFIYNEIKQPVPNDVLLVEWGRRLGQVGTPDLAQMCRLIAVNSPNAVVRETYTQAAELLSAK